MPQPDVLQAPAIAHAGSVQGTTGPSGGFATPMEHDNLVTVTAATSSATNAAGSGEIAARPAPRAPLAAPAAPASAAPGPWASGRLNCPWCTGASYGEAPTFMRHLTNAHAGQPLDQEMVDLLRALERGVCTAWLAGASAESALGSAIVVLLLQGCTHLW